MFLALVCILILPVQKAPRFTDELYSRGHQHEEKLFLKFLFESTADMKNAAIRPRSKELEGWLRQFIGLVQSFQAAKFEMWVMSC